MSLKKDPRSFSVECGDPMAEIFLREAREKGMTLNEVCNGSGLAWGTLLNLKRDCKGGTRISTMRSLAKAVNARIVIQTEDGQIIDPEELVTG